MLAVVQNFTQKIFETVETAFSYVFEDHWNPFHHLGALSFFFFWIVGGTGLYLFIFFETSIFGAYNSIEVLTNEQWYAGGVMRSLHRYCSDAMAVTVTLHLFREFSMGRYTGVRWFSWISGIPLLWLLFAAAIGGYWLIWDQFAQYVAVVTMEWMDWLPNFGDPLARNFLTNESVSDRFFSLLVFLHIGIPLIMLLAMFIHITRITNAKTNPPKGLAIGTLIAFTFLSLIKPAISADAADLSHTQLNIPIDWFYLNVYPLIDSWGPGAVWALLIGISSFLSILPWLRRVKQPPVAVVDPEHCNGCGWCIQDCPFDAIDFTQHPNKAEYRMAVVNEDRCISCGICSGSCPTATPFQHVDELQSGIEIPSFPLDELKTRTLDSIKSLKGDYKIIVFGCDMGAKVEQLGDTNIACISLPCIGFLPPSFVDYVLRKEHVKGVMVTGCCSDNCYYRTGNQWVEDRFEGSRNPHLRTKVAKQGNNVRIHWAGALETKSLKSEILSFAKTIQKIPEASGKRRAFKKSKNYFAQALLYGLFILFIGFFASSPTYTRVEEGYATVKLSLRHTGQLLGECKILTHEELQKLPPNMRLKKVCPRERSAIEFQFLMDGIEVYHNIIEPAGLHNDGKAKLYHRFTVTAGNHQITARLKDHMKLDKYNFQETQNVSLLSGGILVIDFDPVEKKFIVIGSQSKLNQ